MEGMEAKTSGEVKQRGERRSECYRGGRVSREGGLECKSFLSYVFKDACFPPECHDRIKIKTSSSDI